MKRMLLIISLVVYGLLVFVPGASAGKAVTQDNQGVPTFNKEVVRIFQSNCQACHHPGDIAPFSLMTYEDAAPRANAIRRATQERRMPPWKPTEGCGEFLDVRRLSEKDIAILARWADTGAQRGDPADLPPPLEFPDGWALGEPDLVMDSGMDYLPNRVRPDDYHCFTMATQFTEDRWLSAVDIKPGNRSIVHHVLLFVDAQGDSAALEESEGAGYTCFGGPGITTVDILGGWAPGGRTRFLPDGIGMKIPKESRIIMQVHYHPQGPPELDRTRLGLYFAEGPMEKQFRMLPLLNTRFLIPPDERRYRVDLQTVTLPADLTGWAVAPHMHLLGKEMEVRATPPDGKTQCLVNIDDWDFNWQGSYYFAKSVPLPRGTKLDMTAYYDNSRYNPRQPRNAPLPVRWGEGTTDEMFLAFLGITIDGERLGASDWTKSKELEDLLQPVMVMGAPGDTSENGHQNGNHGSHHE